MQDYTVQTVQLKVRGLRKLGAFFTNNRIDPRTRILANSLPEGLIDRAFDLRITLAHLIRVYSLDQRIYPPTFQRKTPQLYSFFNSITRKPLWNESTIT